MLVTSAAASELVVAAERLKLLGQVQGLGVRPAIARLAAELQLAGYVRNTDEGVEIDIEGTSSGLAQFRQRLVSALPRGVRLDQVIATQIERTDHAAFEIVGSSGTGALAARVPTDRAVCAECLTDVTCRGEARHD